MGSLTTDSVRPKLRHGVRAPKSAIANWEIVLQNVPPAQSNSVPFFEKALQALRGNR